MPAIYLEGLVTRYRYLDFRGMGVSDRVALQLPLLEMFVPLRARRELPTGETTARTLSRALRLAGRPVTAEEAAEMGERLSEPIAVLELLKAYDGVIVLGDPGAGKCIIEKVGVGLMLRTMRKRPPPSTGTSGTTGSTTSGFGCWFLISGF